jgi:cell wall-associated NlpC family hydrolase
MTPQQLALGMLLDDGGRTLARLIGALLVVVLVALLVAISVPVMILAAASGPAAALLAQVPGRAAEAPAPPGIASAPAAAATLDRTGTPPAAPSTSAVAVDVAQRYLGVPYVFGGSNPATGLDCSGLVQLVFRQLGRSLPRTAQLQFNATERVSQAQLQPGDLVFFARTYADP